MNGRTSRNALAGVLQTVLSAVLMFAFYRVILEAVGAEGLGVWSVVLASLSAARISELGLSGSAVKYTAGRVAMGDRGEASRVIETTVLTVGVVLIPAAALAYALASALLPGFIAPNGVAAARDLLPYACVSFWMMAVAGALQSGLDGCGRIDLRHAIGFGAQVLYVGLGIWWVHRFGIVGLALAQIVQGGALAVSLWIGIRYALPEAPPIPWRWDRSLFREMLRYGLNFQALSLLRMLFEPTTKVLMSAYGGLQAAGFYEMATLLVAKLRGVIVTAQQALTPEVAFLHEHSPERINLTYERVVGLSTYVAVPLFSGVMVAAPLVSHLWVGEFEMDFVVFVALLGAGWLANTLSGPGFFLLLGTGQMRGVVRSHATIALLNAVLGASLGWVLGGVGVALGWSISLAAGAIHLLVWLRRERGLRLRLPDRTVATIVLPLMIAAAGLSGGLLRPESWISSVVATASAAGLLAILMWGSPYRRDVVEVLRRALG